MVKFIHVIGIGVTTPAELGREAIEALQRSDWVLGSPRQLKCVEHYMTKAQREDQHIKPLLKPLPSLSELAYWLELDRESDHTTVTILASGDPLFYGIGRWLGKRFCRDRLSYYPAVSSIQAACHALGLSLQDVEVLSLHGRPVESVRRSLRRNRTLLILTDSKSNPYRLAEECLVAGFDQSQLTICESLGYPQERVRPFMATDLASVDERDADKSDVDKSAEFDPLHVTVIEVKGEGGVYPEFPGIEDQLFSSDSMMTKREVRLTLLSMLQLGQGETVWDIGAGCGSVSVELALWSANSNVYAIEKNVDRLAHLKENRLRFGVVSNLNIVEGRAPDALIELPAPTRVFLGGSDGMTSQLLKLAWERLQPGGILVASAVTETTRIHIIEFMQSVQAESKKGIEREREAEIEIEIESETLQVAVSRSSTLGSQLLYRPNLPVTLFKWVKR